MNLDKHIKKCFPTTFRPSIFCRRKAKDQWTKRICPWWQLCYETCKNGSRSERHASHIFTSIRLTSLEYTHVDIWRVMTQIRIIAPTSINFINFFSVLNPDRSIREKDRHGGLSKVNRIRFHGAANEVQHFRALFFA